MRRLLAAGAWILVAGLTLPLLAQDAKKDAKGKDEKKEEKPEAKPKPEVKEKLVTAGSLSGRLVRAPGADRMLALGVRQGNRNQNVELLVHDDVKVRIAQPPAMFDDKGKRKKPSQKELDELRGPDRKLPGYTASLDDLKQGQLVSVALVKKAGYKPPKGKDKDKEIPDEFKPQVNLILIVADPTGQ